MFRDNIKVSQSAKYYLKLVFYVTQEWDRPPILFQGVDLDIVSYYNNICNIIILYCSDIWNNITSTHRLQIKFILII